jgi:hypothetical protein
MLCRTNKDLDPVPRHARKWGVTSFISYWVSDAFKYGFPRNFLHYIRGRESNVLQVLQHGNSHPVSLQSVTPSHPHFCQMPTLTPPRSHVARIPWHSRARILHDILRHCAQRRHRRDSPCTLSCPGPRLMGLLGLVHCHHIARHPCHLLVRDPEHERRQCV